MRDASHLYQHIRRPNFTRCGTLSTHTIMPKTTHLECDVSGPITGVPATSVSWIDSNTIIKFGLGSTQIVQNRLVRRKMPPNYKHIFRSYLIGYVILNNKMLIAEKALHNGSRVVYRFGVNNIMPHSKWKENKIYLGWSLVGPTITQGKYSFLKSYKNHTLIG